MFHAPPKILALVLGLAAAPAGAQPNLAGGTETRLALERLNVLGSVLMIGAHPDDEHSATLAYLSRGRSFRTAYLSLTRGEGGQNLIGPEQGELLGVIRTEELLAARRIDGAEQFFTRAIDFGYSKTAEETIAKWGHDKILSDIVWVIRKFRPDVIILCFSGTPRDGHGQHQASAILGKEAFFAAADKNRFPEQLQFVDPWQAKRIVWNVYGPQPDVPGQAAIDPGDYNPVLGYSYAEIAAMSRDMHRSQGMGSPERRGPQVTYFVPVAGEAASKDLFDGIDTPWRRIPGADEVGRVLGQAAGWFDPKFPEKVIPLLLQAHARLKRGKGYWIDQKRREVEEALALSTGLWLDATADRWDLVPGSTVTIHTTALNRSQFAVALLGVSVGGNETKTTTNLPYNQASTSEFTWRVPEDAPYSQPYWLGQPPSGETYEVADQRLIGAPENPPVLEATFRIRMGSEDIDYVRPVQYRSVDRLRGELTRPLAIVPPVALQFTEPVIVFPSSAARKLEVVVRSNGAGAAGQVRLDAPPGWRIAPKARAFQIAEAGQEVALPFEITPPSGDARGRIPAAVRAGGREPGAGMDVIAYPHIRPQTVFTPPEAKLVRADIHILAKRIGYVMGAGDEVPAALRQLGCEVVLLSAGDLASGDLSRFDAIATGVRAFNVRADLRANQQRLLDYVKGGGTLVVQYNVLDYGRPTGALDIGPYPVTISHERVTGPDAPVRFPDPKSPLLQSPNRITAADFEGWVQERGLYFASEWDPRYKMLFESHDPNEPPHAGGTLYARYGQGAYVFTAYSWFRQLPAGVPGAFRIFANLLSAGKVLK